MMTDIRRNLPQGLDAAIHTGLERGWRTVARQARVRRGPSGRPCA
ncbi:MAG: hypothetical protein ACLRWQ_22765 [Flavonifractor plautii]